MLVTATGDFNHGLGLGTALHRGRCSESRWRYDEQDGTKKAKKLREKMVRRSEDASGPSF